ncbi:MAG TPA: histidine kinase, partial [Pedobacter sp.]|nr:histidine kinase [Pedobacter sp.]
AVIHKLDRDTASSYLTCLSRLMRKILEHSDESKITLAQELDVISHYIKLEKLRFGDDMIITVSVEETLQIDKVCVPPLFIQPFLENAILHGILPKNEAGNIEIRLCTLGPEILCCTITDDGVGRSKLEKPIEAFPTGKRSMGMAITNKRISSFNKRNGKSLPVTVNDLKDNNGLSTGTSIGIQLVLISDNDD